MIIYQLFLRPTHGIITTCPQYELSSTRVFGAVLLTVLSVFIRNIAPINVATPPTIIARRLHTPGPRSTLMGTLLNGPYSHDPRLIQAT
jgi:hypothetical protein